MAFSVSVGELHTWPRGKWENDEFTGQRKLLCAWDDMETLSNELSVATTGAWPETEYPWGTALALCRKIRFEPWDAEQLSLTGAYADYGWGVVIADYSTIGPVWSGGNLITEFLNTTQDSISIDSVHLSWDGAADGPPVQPSSDPTRFPIFGAQYTRTYHQLLAVPANTLQFTGFINNLAVASLTLGITFPARTLLYRGPVIQAKHKPGHVSTYKVSYKFDYLPWNRQHFFNPNVANPAGNLGWFAPVFVKDPGGGQLLPYQEVDFN